MKEFWDERYRAEAYAYGTTANNYLLEQLAKLKAGTILFPAEGEGRNAVFAASKNWMVSAFDISKEGQQKALHLAAKKQVEIDYQVGGFEEMVYTPNQFDAIALIFAHFPPQLRSKYHLELNSYLRTGGVLILEAFSKNHLEYSSKNPEVGGPKDVNFLCSIAEIKSDFPNYEILELEEKEIELNEGLFHIGTGSVIRFVGRKK